MKLTAALCLMCLLSACSMANFQFATSQDDSECLKQDPSKNCDSPYEKQKSH